jgi:hypothetical protein
MLSSLTEFLISKRPHLLSPHHWLNGLIEDLHGSFSLCDTIKKWMTGRSPKTTSLTPKLSSALAEAIIVPASAVCPLFTMM